MAFFPSFLASSPISLASSSCSSFSSPLSLLVVWSLSFSVCSVRCRLAAAACVRAGWAGPRGQIDAEKCPFLVERLNITVMPTLILSEDNQVADRLEGFTELGNTEKFATEVLEKVRLVVRETHAADPPFMKRFLLNLALIRSVSLSFLARTRTRAPQRLSKKGIIEYEPSSVEDPNKRTTSNAENKDGRAIYESLRAKALSSLVDNDDFSSSDDEDDAKDKKTASAGGASVGAAGAGAGAGNAVADAGTGTTKQ